MSKPAIGLESAACKKGKSTSFGFVPTGQSVVDIDKQCEAESDFIISSKASTSIPLLSEDIALCQTCQNGRHVGLVDFQLGCYGMFQGHG